MVKVKDFWTFLCDDLGYRFFSGLPCNELGPLYNGMSPKFMHYIPAANETIAAGIVMGASVAGERSCMMVDVDRLNQCYTYISKFSVKHRIPLLIIVGGSYDDCIVEGEYIILDFEYREKLIVMVNRIIKDRLTGMVFIGKDLLR